MPMPRASGGTSATSRPCRRIAPASSSSTPAMSRNSTVFPTPDGPNTTTISPVSAASETSLRTAPVLNPLEMFCSSICDTDSAFHRAKRKSLDKIALSVERDGQRWRHRQHDGGGDLSVLNTRRGHEGERADRHRLLIGGRQDQGKDEIVPAKDEGEQSRRRYAGTGERHRDARESAPPRMAANAVGVFNVGRDILKIAAHDPQDQRQCDQLIDPDQAGVGIRQPDLLKIKRKRQ